MGYTWKTMKLGSGNEVIKIFDVEIMSFIRPEERPDFELPEPGVDSNWLSSAAEKAQLLQQEGKFPKLFLRHNKPFEEAPVIGRLENVRWKAPWVVADVVVTNPDAIEMLKRGELPTRSAEFNFATRHVWGLALIQGEKGHFDTELPELVLKGSEYEEVMALNSLAADSNRSLVLSKLFFLETTMDPETKREIDALKAEQANQGGLLQQILSAVSGTKTVKKDAADAEPDTDDGAEEEPSGAPTEDAALRASKKTQQRLDAHIEETRMNNLVTKVRASGNPMKEEDIRTSLKKLNSWEARELQAEHLAKAPEAPTDELAPVKVFTENKKLTGARAQYRAKLAAKMKENPHLTRQEAVCELNAEDPALHKAYLLAANPDYTDKELEGYLKVRKDAFARRNA